jgi:hypothetical protein
LKLGAEQFQVGGLETTLRPPVGENDAPMGIKTSDGLVASISDRGQCSRVNYIANIQCATFNAIMVYCNFMVYCDVFSKHKTISE